MKKITALLLALLLALSLCTMGAAAADETVAIALEPTDDTLLTAEGLALFFVDRDAITEETETSVSWYKETTKDGKTERELVAEMPLIIKITAVGPRIFVADGYEPSKELIDLVKNTPPKRTPTASTPMAGTAFSIRTAAGAVCVTAPARTASALSLTSARATIPIRMAAAPCAAGASRAKSLSTSTVLLRGRRWTTACTMDVSAPAAMRKWASTTWKRKGFSTPTKLSLLNAALFADLNTVVKWRKYALHISVPGFPGTDFLCVYIRGGVW